MREMATAPRREAVSGRMLAGLVAVVTGASSGIGAATACELARRGARVVLAARRADELTEQVEAIEEEGGEALAVVADVTDPAQIATLIERALASYGQIDILVNNAGIGSSTSFATMPLEQITQVVGVNLLGVALLTRAVLPGMLERRQGVIITVSSVAGHIALNPLYSATKFSVRGFSRSLRRELTGTGVAVSVVSPGFIRTRHNRRIRAPLPGPQVVARSIADLVIHPRREVVVPGYYWGAIWVERLFPGLIDLVTRPRRSRRLPPA